MNHLIIPFTKIHENNFWSLSRLSIWISLANTVVDANCKHCPYLLDECLPTGQSALFEVHCINS